MDRPTAGTSTVAGSLNAAQRKADLARLASDELDVVVVGGGIVGAGAALDAASRGLRTVLVERRDLAHGTSRWSSKLIHGGLRYLRHLELGVAWESARERDRLLTAIAPHLVRPLPFLAPLSSAVSRLDGVLTGAGVRAGDVLRAAAGTGRSALPGPRRVSALEALRLAPGLRPDGLRGALLFWDGQVEDDARLVIAVARTAAAAGAGIVTRCAALGFAGERLRLRDEATGDELVARAKTVVNATGVWAGELDPAVRLRPSKGAHLVLPAAALGDPRAAVIAPVPGESARWVGATPIGDGRVVVGVTDDEHHGPIEDEPGVSAAEETFLLDTLSTVLRRPLAGIDVTGRFAGYRPLLDTGHGATADVSRRHAILASEGGAMLTIVGGKLTTYRRMAEEVVDRVVDRCGGPPSATSTLPLLGAAGSAADGVPERLARRYGGEAGVVAGLAAADPRLLEPLFEGSDVLGVELAFGVLHEGATTVADLLDRRVRLGLVPAERARAEPAAARLLMELG